MTHWFFHFYSWTLSEASAFRLISLITRLATALSPRLVDKRRATQCRGGPGVFNTRICAKQIWRTNMSVTTTTIIIIIIITNFLWILLKILPLVVIETMLENPSPFSGTNWRQLLQLQTNQPRWQLCATPSWKTSLHHRCFSYHLLWNISRKKTPDFLTC